MCMSGKSGGNELGMFVLWYNKRNKKKGEEEWEMGVGKVRRRGGVKRKKN